MWNGPIKRLVYCRYNVWREETFNFYFNTAYAASNLYCSFYVITFSDFILGILHLIFNIQTAEVLYQTPYPPSRKSINIFTKRKSKHSLQLRHEDWSYTDFSRGNKIMQKSTEFQYVAIVNWLEVWSWPDSHGMRSVFDY